MSLEQPEQHTMTLEATHSSGAEEWYCPTCGRRFLMQWPPEFSRVIIEPGDETAAHSGGKGGISISTGVDFTNESGIPGEQESKYGPWLDWMENSDFDRLWDADLD